MTGATSTSAFAPLGPGRTSAAISRAALLLLLLLSATPARAMELEGKTDFIDVPVKNYYAGVLTERSAKVGDEVRKDDVLGHYRLAVREVEAIRKTLDAGGLLDLDSRVSALNLQIAAQGQAVERLRDSVRSGYESPLRLQSEEAELTLLRSRRDAALRDRADQEAAIARDAAHISENLQGLKVTRANVPEIIPLRAPFDGVVSAARVEPGARLAAKAECFRVAARFVQIKAKAFAEDYQKLQAGQPADVSIQGFPDRTFQAVLLILPVKPVDKGSMARSYYEVIFRLLDTDVFVREGLRARVTLP